MYGPCNSSLSHSSSSSSSSSSASDFCFNHLPPPGVSHGPLSLPLLPQPLIIAEEGFSVNELDSLPVHEVAFVTSNYGSCASGSGSPSSPMSYCTQGPSLIERTASSHSLTPRNGLNLLVSSPTGLNDNPVRRVFSTGDLQGVNPLARSRRAESPLSIENSAIIEGMMAKARCYSPEEKREKIERYRSKRTQRNFNKKIQYACRKTLADTRPRIKGRFARNDEQLSNSPQNQWTIADHDGGENDDEDVETWISLLDSLDSTD
ncbi:hypothetical protein Nepgr_014619 [Nepenthes gracilis]|uniref:CCT domain-containing protein n=1 Tax=Nepenthes gracilis TaxID=150966 RepID=A0AAD3XQ09_NEPGR|nr:hypothetical protein Nepgr_014619 [Nepenthes gracilis]